MPFTIACPKCQKTLMVPDAAVGKKVRCPACQEVIAVPAAPPAGEAVTAAPPPVPAPAPSVPAPPPIAAHEQNEVVEQGETPAKSKAAEGPFAFSDDDEAEERPARRKRSRDEDYDDEDDDFDDLAPIRRRPSAPHRGAAILTIGIISIFAACACAIAGWVLGAIAINMANTDLAQMSIGRMDQSGRGNTQAGKICGIIGVILGVINAIAGIAIQVGRKH